MEKKIVWLICIGLYVVSLTILIFNAFNNPMANDRSTEYQEYLSIVDSGTWVEKNDSLVNSSVVATFIPAVISRYFHIDPDIVFNVFPCIFQALMPVFVFLIARRYMNNRLSLLSALFVISQYNFIYNSNIGRVSIAIGILTVYVWAMINRRYAWAGTCAVVMVFSHYGTSVIALALTALGILGIVIHDRFKSWDWLKAGTVLTVFGIVIGIWYFGIADTTGRYITGFINNSAGQVITFNPSDSIDTRPITAPPASTTVSQSPSPPPQSSNSFTNTLLSMQGKEYILQVAFGLRWGEMNTYQKVEWGVCWLIITLLLFGIGTAVFRKKLTGFHLLATLGSLGMIGLAMLIPYVSMKYGVVRTYFTAMVVIAPFFIYGLWFISDKLKINPYILPGVFVVVNAVVVCGSKPPYFFGLINV